VAEVVIAVRDLLRNRAMSKDRPNEPKACRAGSMAHAKRFCKQGHNWKYIPWDNYGCCDKCGCEVLT